MAENSTFPYRRIVVIGTTSSGKSTLAENLSKKLGLDFIELDALHWMPNWQPAPDEVFRSLVDERTSGPAWAVAGNYSLVRDLVWSRAEAVIWLDYSLWTIFWRLTRRTFSRWWRQELLWGTNRENMWNHIKLWSEESLFHWLFKTYWRRKREIPMLLSQPQHAHLKTFIMKSPRATLKWFESL